MKRELMLLRHGKSGWGQALPDFDRALKERGRRNARALGAWLSRHGLLPDYIVSSPAVRAMETATLLCQAMDRDAAGIHPDARIYAATLEDLLAVLGSVPEDPARVLLVGHNPGLEDLLAHLAGPDLTPPADGKLLPTATLARLRMPGHWQDLAAGSARLLDLLRPGTLAED